MLTVPASAKFAAGMRLKIALKNRLKAARKIRAQNR